MPKIAEVVGVFGIVVVDHAVEERGGRQLLLVPGNHQLASAINRTDGIPEEHLRSLVKDDDIELEFGRFQVRADCERTHHETRLESDESIRHTSEKLSQRQVSLLLVDFGGVARLDPPATLEVPRLRSLRSSRAEEVSTSDHTASPQTPKQWHASTSKAIRAGPPRQSKTLAAQSCRQWHPAPGTRRWWPTT